MKVVRDWLIPFVSAFYILIYFKYMDWRYSLIVAAIALVAWCWSARSRWLAVAAVSALAFSLLITRYWFAGRAFWVTAFLLVASVFLAYRVVKVWANNRPVRRLCWFTLCAVASAGLFWITASTYDYFAPARCALPLDSSRLEARKDRWPTTRVAIALSGGGYRAAFMHAGVLDAYEQLDVKISTISGVSGGSIIGSYYAAGGPPKSLFQGLTSQDFDLEKRILQFPNLLHLALKAEIPLTGLRLNPFSDFNGTMVQSHLFDDVFLHGTTWKTLRENHAPRLLIGTTDLIHGAAVGFAQPGVLHRAMSGPIQSDDYQNGFLVDERSLILEEPGKCEISSRLSEVVAASGAFPLAFSSIDPKCLESFAGDSKEYGHFLLADGGVADNSGVSLLIAAGNVDPGWQSDVVLVSDAGSLLPDLDDDIRLLEPDIIASSSVLQSLRSIDVIFSNSHSKRFGGSTYNPKKLLLSPSMFVHHWFARSIYGNADKDESEDFRRPAFEALKIAAAEYGGWLLSIPLRGITEQEFTYIAPKVGIGAPIKDRKTLLAETGKCCDSSIGSPFKEVSDSVVGFMAHDFAACAKSFLHFSTLTSTPSLEEANRVFRLGQYLAILNWNKTKNLLDAFEAYHKLDKRLTVNADQPEGELPKIGGLGKIRFEVANPAMNEFPEVEFHTYIPSNLSVLRVLLEDKTSGMCSISGQVVSCLLGDLPAKSKRTVIVDVRVLRFMNSAEFGFGSDDGVVKVVGFVSSSLLSRDVAIEAGGTQLHIRLS